MKKTTDFCFMRNAKSSHDDFSSDTSAPEKLTGEAQLSLDLNFWGVDEGAFLIRPCKDLAEFEHIVEGLKAELDVIAETARIQLEEIQTETYYRRFQAIRKRKVN
jgi:hypothetical protein